MTRDEAIESVTLTRSEAVQILRALDIARDTIQPITTAQVILHKLDPNTDLKLDAAAAILQEKMK